MRKLVSMILYLFLFLLADAAAPEAVQQADVSLELPAGEKYVALTFDDGPRRGTTDRLLDGLQQRRASATFFLVGNEIPGKEDLVVRMKEEGHQVGNHTWSHVRLTGEDTAALLAEVDRTDALLRKLLGEDTYWLRPPYGFVEEPLLRQIDVPMVKWSVDPRDWESRDKEKVVQAVMDAVRPNSIVLLHDIYGPSVDAALEIVEQLQAEGYWLVTVEELLRINGISPQAGTFYRTGKG